MKRIFYLLIFVNIVPRTISSISKDTFETIVHFIFKENNFSRALVLMDTDGYTADNYGTNVIVRQLSQQVPTTVINLNKTDLTGIIYSRSSTLCVIIQNGDSCFEKVNRTLSVLVKTSHVPPRPKCLVALLRKQKYEDVRRILLAGWKLKFLDFTILSMTGDNCAAMYNYNPFTDTVHTLKCASSSFPDKLRNLHNYTLTIPVFHAPPLMFYFKESKMNKTMIFGKDYATMEILSRRLNFFINPQPHNVSRNSNGFFQSLVDKLTSGEANMLGTSYLVGEVLLNADVGIGHMYQKNKLVIIAPILPSSKLIYPSSLLVDFVLLIIFIALSVALSLVMKFPRNQWQFHHILQRILGVAVVEKSTRDVERIGVLFLYFLSVRISAKFISELTDVELIYSEVSFDTPEEILEYGMTVYVPQLVKESAFDEPSGILKKLRPNMQKLHHTDCVRKLESGERCVCISPKRTAKYLLTNSTIRLKKPVMKITAKFLSDFLAIAYETGSPFIEKFDSLIQRLFEAGITEMNKYRKPKRLEDHDRDKYEFLLEPELVWILSIGTGVSVLTFVAEILVHRWNHSALVSSIKSLRR